MSSEQKTPLVSAIIATYNMGQYLPGAIKSVLNQKIQDLELIIVDDGSTDNTGEVVKPFLSDPRVRYIYQPNSGQTKAKNAGLKASRGAYIGYCDADDEWHPDKLSLQIPLLEQDPNTAVVYGRICPMDQAGAYLYTETASEYSGYITQQLFLENFIPFGSALIRRSAIEEVGGFDENRRMGIDWDLWLRLSIKHRFECLRTVIYFYRVWEGQMSNNWRGRYESAFSIMRDFEARHPGVIAGSTRRKAYALSYANRGQIRAKMDNDRMGCVLDALKAMRYGVCLSSSIRTLLKAFVRFPYR